MFGCSASGNTRRPGDDCWNTQPPFQQFGLFPRERPGIGEALAAIVTGKNNYRIFTQSIRIQRLQHAPNLLVHSFDHALVGFLRTAVEISKISKATARLPQALRLHLVTEGLPSPVRSVEVQAEQEGLPERDTIVHDF